MRTVQPTRSRLAHLGGLLASIALIAAPAGATPTQGTLGATSQGQINITASVPKMVQISGLADIDLSNSNPNTAAISSQNDCVWSNTASKGYNITATGSGSSGAFTLANGSLTVPYSVQWAATSGASTGTGLTAGTALTGLTSTATKPQCTSTPSTSSTLIVTIAATDLQSMTAVTNYTGTLTLLVSPN